MKYIILVVALLLCSCCHRAPEPVPREDIIKRALSCTVRVESVEAGLGGSGVAILNRPGSPLRILTARHVVDEDMLYKIRFEGGKWIPVVRSRSDKVSDLAILESMPPKKKGCEAFIGSRALRGDKVWTTGWPKFEGLSFSPGDIVATMRWKLSRIRKGASKRVYMTNVHSKPGWSGGGLWSTDGSLIGITWAGIAQSIGPFRIHENGTTFFTHTDELVKFFAAGVK